MQIRDRIREFRRVPARSLRPNPRNWRTHPAAQQDALRGVLAEIGYADALLARELPDGSLELIDGHLRAETTPDQEVPVLVLDLTPAEADKLLVTLDPLSALAGRDNARLAELLAEVETSHDGLRQLFDALAAPPTDALPAPPADELPEVDVPQAWQLLVECADEADQQALFEQLKQQGYPCRVLTL